MSSTSKMSPSDMSWRRRGRIGERYILGHANLTLPELFQLLAQVSGMNAPTNPYSIRLCLSVRLRQRVGGSNHYPQTTFCDAGRGKVVP